MSAVMKYSIIIVTHNSAEDLPGCLGSIVESSPDSVYEVIIADNASTDNSQEIFSALEGDVSVIRNRWNTGYARAANQGIAAAKGDYLVFLNPDTQVTPGWLEKMSRHLKKNGAGAVGPLSNYVAGLQKFELYCPPADSESPQEINLRLERRYRGHSVETKLLIGFCLMIHRKTFEEFGNFDDDLILGSEDLEYSQRLTSAGKELAVALDTFIYHQGHTSYRGESDSERWNNLTGCILNRKLERRAGDYDQKKIWGIDWFHPQLNSSRDLVSIVIPAYNGLKYTKMCLDSIRRNTIHPYELIIVDNGSSDGTAEFLSGQQDVRLIKNPENRGYPAACNQGIEASTAPNLLLLNNDVIVTEYWLSRMFQGFFADPKAGLIGPRTNDSAGYQQVSAPSFDSAAALDEFARKMKKISMRQFREVNYLSGFAMLIGRKVIDEIGLLDERFGIGNYEDQDFCKRAEKAGFKILIANEVFIHHFGSRAFAENNLDYQAVLSENRTIYEQKWSGAEA